MSHYDWFVVVHLEARIPFLFSCGLVSNFGLVVFYSFFHFMARDTGVQRELDRLAELTCQIDKFKKELYRNNITEEESKEFQHFKHFDLLESNDLVLFKRLQLKRAIYWGALTIGRIESVEILDNLTENELIEKLNLLTSILYNIQSLK